MNLGLKRLCKDGITSESSGANSPESVGNKNTLHTLALALFGIAHVTSELRYVDYRFSHRLGRKLRQWLFFFLGTIVIIRILNGSQRA
jgi:hypothetical protein